MGKLMSGVALQMALGKKLTLLPLMLRGSCNSRRIPLSGPACGRLGAMQPQLLGHPAALVHHELFNLLIVLRWHQTPRKHQHAHKEDASGSCLELISYDLTSDK